MSGMDRLTELLPCPFCGNDGSGPIEEALHIMFSEPDWREDAAWSVQCDKCTATMGYSDSEDGAIAAWNRRASQAAPAPSDGLRKAVDAAWNDAIEAAAETIPPTVVYIGGGVIASSYLKRDIRALRRAAPTEGEA